MRKDIDGLFAEASKDNALLLKKQFIIFAASLVLGFVFGAVLITGS